MASTKNTSIPIPMSLTAPGLSHDPDIRVYFGACVNRWAAELLVGEYVLESFAYITGEINPYRPFFAGMMLDSGAFSVKSKGQEVNLDEYVEFAGNRQEYYDTIVNLDVDGDPDQGLKNAEYMIEQGIKDVMEVYHFGEPREVLVGICERAASRGNWIGIGGMAVRRKIERKKFLGDCQEVLDDFPEVRVHGFGMGTDTDACRLFSIDSTTWFRELAAFRGTWNPGVLKEVMACLTDREIIEILKKKYRRLPILEKFTREDQEQLLDLKPRERTAKGWGSVSRYKVSAASIKNAALRQGEESKNDRPRKKRSKSRRKKKGRHRRTKK